MCLIRGGGSISDVFESRDELFFLGEPFSLSGSDPIVITLYFFGGEGILSFICGTRLRTDLYSHCSQLAIS